MKYNVAFKKEKLSNHAHQPPFFPHRIIRHDLTLYQFDEFAFENEFNKFI